MTLELWEDPVAIATKGAWGLGAANPSALGAQVPLPSRLGVPAKLACHIVENSVFNREVIHLDGAIRWASR